MIAAPLPQRQLGGSPVCVTELSFGGAAIGNLFTEVGRPGRQGRDRRGLGRWHQDL